MKDLIAALQIFMKYANDDRNPVNCSHDQLTICAGIEKSMVSDDDIKQLDTLGFFWDEADECFISFRFGSC